MNRFKKAFAPDTKKTIVPLHDITNGSFQGDPNMDNQPRIEPMSGLGEVADTKYKFVFRNYCEVVKQLPVYITRGLALNAKHRQISEELGFGPRKSQGALTEEEVTSGRSLLKKYIDVRLLGAVASTGKHSCGTHRGSLQVHFGTSVDPIDIQEIVLTRRAITTEKDALEKRTEMGHKYKVPYALYVGGAEYNSHYGLLSGVTAEDLQLFFESLVLGWDFCRSSTNGLISCRGLYVFVHDHPLGNAPEQDLRDLIQIEKKEGVVFPRSFKDYQIQIQEPPKGVTMYDLTRFPYDALSP